MHRIVLILATAGIIAFGIAGTPAQAHEGWRYGPQQWREDQWRGHAWRYHEWHSEPHVTILRGSQISNR